MGVLQIAHAMAGGENLLVFLYVSSMLAGAVGFALCLFDKWLEGMMRRRWVPHLVVGGALLYCFLAFALAGALPRMVLEGRFTLPACAVNLFAGVLFALVFLRILVDSIRQPGWGLYMLASVALVCAIAGLSFPFSDAWSHAWWAHHLLRFCAFLSALVVLLQIYRRASLEREESLRGLLFFKQLVENSVQGCGLGTLDGTVTYVNPSLANMLKLRSPDDAVGREIVPFYPDEIQEKMVGEVLPAVMEKGVWKGESALKATDGSTVPILENFFLVRDDRGNPACLADVMLDISEWKSAQASLRANEERMRAFLEGTGDLVTQVDTEGRMLYLNRAAQNLYGLSDRGMRWSVCSRVRSPQGP